MLFPLGHGPGLLWAHILPPHHTVASHSFLSNVSVFWSPLTVPATPLSPNQASLISFTLSQYYPRFLKEPCHPRLPYPSLLLPLGLLLTPPAIKLYPLNSCCNLDLGSQKLSPKVGSVLHMLVFTSSEPHPPNSRRQFSCLAATVVGGDHVFHLCFIDTEYMVELRKCQFQRKRKEVSSRWISAFLALLWWNWIF